MCWLSLVSRHYRNRRIGDFLKEMHITEGRSTGFPKIHQAVKRNDSPMPIFETDERNGHFLATTPNIELSERQTIILKLITKDCTITSEKISEKISEKKPVTTRTIEKDIAQLKQYGILYREGGRKDGRWVIMNKNDNKE